MPDLIQPIRDIRERARLDLELVSAFEGAADVPADMGSVWENISVMRAHLMAVTDAAEKLIEQYETGVTSTDPIGVISRKQTLT